MKQISAIILLLVLVSGGMLAADPTVQAGIFAAGTHTVQVMAKPVGGGLAALVSSIVVPVAWETAAGLTVESVDYAPGLMQTDTGEEGIYSYAVYSMFPNQAVDWAEGTENVILTLTFSGTGPVVVSLQNIAGLSWYFETGAGELTDHETPYYAPTTEMPLPVTLTSFTGRIAQGGTAVLLEWVTASEVNNYGYTVQRRPGQESAFADLADGFVPGHGTTLEARTYHFEDKTIAGAGAFEYRLKQQDLNGALRYTSSVIVPVSLTEVVEAAPRVFQLMQNYPNPFNPSTRVKFSVPATGPASIRVYNALGEEVALLFDGVAEAGRYYTVPFDAARYASGVYFYRLVAESKTDVRKMMMVK